MNYKLTIAIPVYNGSHTIGLTLQSVLRQLEDDIEIIVSDNCSTDSTGSIVREYVKNNNNIRYFVNEENVGFDRNVELALLRASGEYVWFLGDDDEICLGGLKYVLKVLERYRPATVFVNYALFDRSSGECIEPRALKIDQDFMHSSCDEYLKKVTIFPNFLSSNIVRRDYWEEEVAYKYMGTNWIQYVMMLHINMGRNAYCIAKPFVMNKAYEAGAPNEFNSKGVAIKILLTLLKVVFDMPCKFYSMQAKSMVANEAYKMLPRKIASAKKNGLKYSLELHRKLADVFGDKWLFWVRESPMLLGHRVFYVYVWKLYKSRTLHWLYRKTNYIFRALRKFYL